MVWVVSLAAPEALVVPHGHRPVRAMAGATAAADEERAERQSVQTDGSLLV
jgi:hypothetical protein